MPFYYFDSTYILVIIGLLLTLGTQFFVSSNYRKYKKINTKSGLEGYEVARKMLDDNNLSDIDIIETRGELTDHYDPTRRVIRLSTDIYHNSSIASASVAAHECGHSIQDKEGYSFLKIRNSCIPIVNFLSKAGYVAIVIGLLMDFLDLLWLGIFIEIIILLFQLITLPVEFDASKRALEYLNNKILDEKEHEGSKKMLNAAAMTYVASVATAFLQLLRLVLIASSKNDRR